MIFQRSKVPDIWQGYIVSGDKYNLLRIVQQCKNKGMIISKSHVWRIIQQHKDEFPQKHFVRIKYRDSGYNQPGPLR